MNNVNIIMSVYNGEKYLREQIDSIVGQTVKNWKLFIFDDCSTDASYDIAQEYEAKYKSQIHVFKNPYNMGSTQSFLYNLCRVSGKYSDNEKIKILNGYKLKVKKKITKKLADTAINLKNSAVKLYRHPHIKPEKERCREYYMFADQDDFWLMDKVSLTLAKMRKTEKRHGKHKPALVFTDAILVDENLKFLEQSFFRTNHMKAKKKDLAHILMENKCIGCTCMVNQSAADVLRNTYPLVNDNEKNTEQYSNVRYHDWWMALICASFGCIRYLDVPTIMYRQHGGNQVGQTSFNEYMKERQSERERVAQRLEETRLQAKGFYELYGFDIKKKRANLIEKFVKLNTYGPVKKRLYLLRYRFLKSGFVRNVGLMLYI